MDTDDFWELIETARESAVAGRAFHEVLADLLAARTEQEILKYQEKFDEAHQALYRWDVWAAAYLIGGGCSDDSFIDFRAGLIAQGRGWYQKAADSPDNLAEHPAVAAAAGRPWDNPLFYEVVNYAASRAFERVSGDEHGFWDALSARDERDRTPADMGEDFDFDDEQEMRRRLPRLAALCLGDNAALGASHRQSRRAAVGGRIGRMSGRRTWSHHLGEQLMGTLRARLAVTLQLAGQSGLLRRLGRARPTGRPGVRGDLIQQAQRAQQVRPPVPALPVLPHEVRRASS
jgi:Protein of unknown function (DUF4240)